MMIPPLAAAWELHLFLTTHQIPYAIIGGIAVQYWGEPRLTVDVDLTVAVPPEDTADFVQLIAAHFEPRVAAPIAFARKTRMVLIRAANGCEVDISLGLPGYEEQAIERAVDWQFEVGKTVRLCSAEDLIIHKAVAGRPQDLIDIEGIVHRRGDALDVAYIRRWLEEFAAILADSDVIERFERPWQVLKEK